MGSGRMRDPPKGTDMASSIESVSVEGMQLSGNVHLQTAEHVRTSYQRMVSLTERAEAGWQGEAGAAFKAALDSWMSNYAIVAGVLDDMHSRMGQNLVMVSGTHEATTSAARQVGAVTAEPVGLIGF
ncbi:WXG100 family type VII secretion target [Streptomyces sp. NPDC090106]|uniref:WXG100 family type VII secretion target n=1 Tax=Streptomyces sp. NPDC090106 TaxID=3365946 RepID=UPI0037F7D24A